MTTKQRRQECRLSFSYHTVSAKRRFFARSAAVLLAAALFAVLPRFFLPRAAAADQTDGLIRYVVDNVRKGASRIDVSAFRFAYSEELKQAVSDRIYYELPELFCVEGLTFTHTDLLRTVDVTYNCAPEEYGRMLAECVSAADRLLNGIEGNAALGETEKALLIHDRLAVHCAYDEAAANGGTPGARARDLYGALVERTAVCDGYTRAYLYLLNRVGVRCGYCYSLALNHSWNLVWIGGVPYHVDVTFDDPFPDIAGRVQHDNFLLSTAAFYANNHAAGDYSTLPASTAFDDRFWKRSEAAFSLAGGGIYYVDTPTGTVRRYADQSAVFAAEGVWGRYPGCYARLASFGTELYYSGPDGVYRWETTNGKREKIFSPTLAGSDRIYGFRYEDGQLICEVIDSPNGAPSAAGRRFLTSLYAPHSHVFSQKETPPDCERDGYRTFTCACGYSYSEVTVRSTGHDRVTDPGLPAACRAAGLTEGCRCKACGKTLVEAAVIPPLGHDLVLTYTPPGCATAGKAACRCQRCGGAWTEPLASFFHTPGWTFHDETGAAVRGCAICGAAIPPPGDAVAFGRYDVNRDGAVNEADAHYALQASIGLPVWQAGSREFRAADVNGDGALTAGDARAILRLVNTDAPLSQNRAESYPVPRKKDP